LQFSKRFWIGSVFVHVDHTLAAALSSGQRFEKEALGRFPISGWTQHEVKRVPA
jgi:hypothetical protein